ncbi:LPS export ABC transporter periplasmic protein LptC [Sphingopyxis yananensis]|uniref:LPS export ABC transporter periplasmic protein LptC n=1 Tax=Sphingopyxis yananensis TaxID=2886687 RepID=UPI001D0FF720|nr:LPS export ABC transporter periplasmic protein LptC [Sphingopyxis yananensis]MCC2601553.1 LPS export ABC transporter periplasmic protein LptC [Sphingopyxis yananensis]
MSERAERQRQQRKNMARSGSGYDRLIASLRLILPVLIGVIAAILLFSPFTQRSEISFLLAKDKVEVAKERMKVSRAEYRGQDNKGQPFALIAGSAVQKSSAEPVVRLQDLSAAIKLDTGPATLAAKSGAYNMENEQVEVPGLVQLRTNEGYIIDVTNVAIDMKNRSMAGRGGVQGQLNVGRFSANEVQADLDARTIKLTGNARLRINQGVLK